MSRKQRKQKRLTLTISALIAAVPLSLSLFFDAGGQLPDSVNYFKKEPAKVVSSGKILPILANN